MCVREIIKVQLAPHRRVVRWAVFAAWGFVDFATGQAVGGLWGQEQVVNAKAVVVCKGPFCVVPITVNMAFCVQAPPSIAVAEVKQGAKAGA